MQKELLAFQDFVDELQSASDVPAVRRTVARTLDALAFPVFAYVGNTPRTVVAAAPLIVATYPEGWAARYTEMAYHRFDAVFATANAELLPFDWGSESYLAPLEKRPRQIFNEAGEFGIARGFTVPVHDVLGQIASLTVATHEPDRLFQKNIAEQRQVLHLMGIYLHVHIQRCIEKIAAPPVPRLSPRESECLRWAAVGKSNNDIGTILGLSRRTVVFHIENAKAKLGVRTIQQAVVAAISFRLIDR